MSFGKRQDQGHPESGIRISLRRLFPTKTTLSQPRTPAMSLLTKSKTSPSFLSGIGSSITGALTGAATGLVDVALQTGVQKLAGKITGTKAGGLPAIIPNILPRVLPSIPGGGGALGKILPPAIGGAIGGAAAEMLAGSGAGVACPAGFHPAKDGSGRCVRNRRMNPLNPRAFRRAVRRLKGARRFAREVEKVFPRPRRQARRSVRHITGPQHG